MNAVIPSPAAQAGWRSAGYRLLSLLFRYPEHPFAFDVVDEWLCTGFPDLAGLPEISSLPALQKEHVRLFHRNLTPLDSAYTARDPFTKGNVIADVAGFYRAFAVDAAEGQSGPDTLEGELEFMAWLTAKEESALAAGTLENAWICHEAEGKFLREHLGRWLPAILSDLRDSAPDGFYHAVAALVEAFLRRELEREFSLDWKELSQGVTPLKKRGERNPHVEDGREIDCPMSTSPLGNTDSGPVT